MDYSNDIINAIQSNVLDAEVFVEKISDENHLFILVKSNIFQGKSILEQHRTVQNILKNNLGKDFIGNKVHAIQIKTTTKV